MSRANSSASVSKELLSTTREYHDSLPAICELPARRLNKRAPRGVGGGLSERADQAGAGGEAAGRRRVRR